MNIINKKYKLIEKIGEGSFGLIYKGQNIRTGEYVAIKVETINSNIRLLKNESTIYQYLNNTLGIPEVKWFGKDNINYYMVLKLLGSSLQTLKNQYKKFSLSTTLKLGIKIIILLKTIHDKELIHRDIKPENFLLDINNETNNIYIIDFGFCKSYKKEDCHISFKDTHNLIGSPMYASINAHKFKELSRRDDMESLGYMLIYFYLGSLTWQNELDNDKIINFKENIIHNDNIPLVLIDYIKYIFCLNFEEKPNYSLIVNNFKREIELVKNSN
jgi:casein kinase I family protein HRR25